MLLKKESSCLLLIDVQEKLTPLVVNSTSLIARCEWLMRLATELKVPQLVSEQYPQGLGTTIKPLDGLVSREECFEKVHFSALRAPLFKQRLQTLNKNQVVLIGIETHVCVLQTVIDLKEAGYEVFVVIDAVSSRKDVDHKYGLKRMKQVGAYLVTSEMVFFEWVEQAGTLQFKALSKAYLR